MRPLLLLSALVLAGCRNNCQQLCADMARFAEDCGYEWTKDDVKQCREDFAGSNVGKNTREYCGTVSDALTEEWECEDLDVYFQGGGGSSDTGS